MILTAKIEAFAQAIARAEGFGVPGAVPTRAHNPGDLVIPGWTLGSLGAGICVFSSDAEGWERLYHELQLIANGWSHVYNLDMTISEMAAKWTRTQVEEWAGNVASDLDTTPDTSIRSLLT